MWATSVAILVFLGLSVLDLGQIIRDKQTDRCQTEAHKKQRESLMGTVCGTASESVP